MSKNQELFRLIAVKALDGSRLQLSYADSAKFAVDLNLASEISSASGGVDQGLPTRSLEEVTRVPSR